MISACLSASLLAFSNEFDQSNEIIAYAYWKWNGKKLLVFFFYKNETHFAILKLVRINFKYRYLVPPTFFFQVIFLPMHI